MCCYNPALAKERGRKRDELLAATEAELAKIAAATGRARRPLRGKDNIALRVGTVRNKFKMAKHFDVMKERGLRSSCPFRARMLGVLTQLRRRRPL